MVGLDCEVAGEAVCSDVAGLQGLLRMKVDVAQQDVALRRAAAQGRLIVTGAERSEESLPGVHYRLLATDADEQFAELLEVFGLQALLEQGASRCGICNGNEWRTLAPADVVDHVPQAVVESGLEFYQCGRCGQIFWDGEKYSNTMDALRAVVTQRGALREGEAVAVQG